MDERVRPPGIDRLYAQAMELAMDLDSVDFGDLDDYNLVEVAIALSRWRDQLA